MNKEDDMQFRPTDHQPAHQRRAGGDYSAPVDAPAEQHALPSTQACAVEDTPDRRKRACTSRRVKLADTDSDGQEDDNDKCSNEMLQKRLRTLTDEKEIKRLKRLLRNRISAQTARERKKQYVNDLEDQMRDKDKEIAALSCQVQELSADNSTLRRLIITMRGGVSKRSQKPAVLGSGSRMGRPVRQEAPHGMAVPGIQHPSQQPSEDSQNDAAKVPQHD